MGRMKQIEAYIRMGGDDAIAAVSEYVKELEGEVASARACAEMMLQGTGQKLGEELARRVIDEHYPPRWIPVEARLPEDGQSVLACFEKSGGVGCATFVERYKWFETDRGCFGATHWMPLPEPPEAKPMLTDEDRESIGRAVRLTLKKMNFLGGATPEAK